MVSANTEPTSPKLLTVSKRTQPCL
jgi:hypothetical protein